MTILKIVGIVILWIVGLMGNEYTRKHGRPR
jgi:hypothetical protein